MYYSNEKMLEIFLENNNGVTHRKDFFVFFIMSTKFFLAYKANAFYCMHF